MTHNRSSRVARRGITHGNKSYSPRHRASYPRHYGRRGFGSLHFGSYWPYFDSSYGSYGTSYGTGTTIIYSNSGSYGASDIEQPTYDELEPIVEPEAQDPIEEPIEETQSEEAQREETPEATTEQSDSPTPDDTLDGQPAASPSIETCEAPEVLPPIGEEG